MGFAPPAGALGADLLYWVEDGAQHTLVTFAGALFLPWLGAPRGALDLCLFDAGGALVRRWREELTADGAVVVDSRALARAGPVPAEGLLAAFVTVPGEAPETTRHLRCGAMIDWLSDEGDVACLHSDQSVLDRGDEPLELTEIVVDPAREPDAELVVLGGLEAQPGGVALTLRGARGERRAADERTIPPLSVRRVRLADLAPDLAALGPDVSCEGRLAGRGLFTRPYVLSRAGLRVLGGYHGGDRSAFSAIPARVHRAIPYAEAAGAPPELLLAAGQRETNPGYAVVREGLETRVHLFQSHGDVEEDFAVDAWLFDRSGALVAERRRWLEAPRRGARSADVAELTGGRPFEGHLSLAFSDDPHARFPRRLQALFEHRAPRSVARAMLWSDRWNTPWRLAVQGRVHRAAYRVFLRGPRESVLAITNPGAGPDYDRAAPWRARLRGLGGEERVSEGTLAPNATWVGALAELFPERPEGELGLLTVESPFDLASFQLVRDVRSGAIAAEHLLAICERDGERDEIPCGA